MTIDNRTSFLFGVCFHFSLFQSEYGLSEDQVAGKINLKSIHIEAEN